MLSDRDKARARFAAGDEVVFRHRRTSLAGTITRMNPTRAVVRVNADDYAVPHDALTPNAEVARERLERIMEIHDRATALLAEYGLRRWTFAFDHSTRRAGKCCYSTKTISIAFDLAANGADTDVRDTILHEIAHALVGRKHGHGPAWRAKVVALGGSPARTHQLEFSPPRWNVTCENRCWTQTAQQRNSRRICRKCGGGLIYTPHHPG